MTFVFKIVNFWICCGLKISSSSIGFNFRGDVEQYETAFNYFPLHCAYSRKLPLFGYKTRLIVSISQAKFYTLLIQFKFILVLVVHRIVLCVGKSIKIQLSDTLSICNKFTMEYNELPNGESRAKFEKSRVNTKFNILLYNSALESRRHYFLIAPPLFLNTQLINLTRDFRS